MNASQLPMDFHAFCDEPQSREDYTNTERTIFYVESERGLERASRIMDAKLAQQVSGSTLSHANGAGQAQDDHAMRSARI